MDTVVSRRFLEDVLCKSATKIDQVCEKIALGTSTYEIFHNMNPHECKKRTESTEGEG